MISKRFLAELVFRGFRILKIRRLYGDMTFQCVVPAREQFRQKSFYIIISSIFYQNLYPEVPFMYCCRQISPR